jgi:hypothetical protein
MHQLLCVVAIVETVRNGSGLGDCDVVVDLPFSCPAIIDNANMPEATLGVTPPSKDDLLSKVTSQPVTLKNTLQLALQRIATDRRLLVRPGRLWAMWAFGSSLWSRTSTAWVVLILSPPG